MGTKIQNWSKNIMRKYLFHAFINNSKSLKDIINEKEKNMRVINDVQSK